MEVELSWGDEWKWRGRGMDKLREPEQTSEWRVLLATNIDSIFVAIRSQDGLESL